MKSLNSSDEHSTLDTEAHHNMERRGQGEQHPSPFAFPSEDEPVTMISKSIPPSLVNMTSLRSRNSEEGISIFFYLFIIRLLLAKARCLTMCNVLLCIER